MGDLNLGLCKQICMKIDSMLTDIYEIREEDDLSEDNAATFELLTEISLSMGATVLNMVSKEMNEDEFMSEMIDMDNIESYPEIDNDDNLLDSEL